MRNKWVLSFVRSPFQQIVEWNNTFTEMGPPLEHRLKREALMETMEQQGFNSLEVAELSEAAYLFKAVKG